jgi:hypothetical protein
MVSTRLAAEDRNYVDDVETALEHLEHPDDHPAARLAADIYFLRCAAERRPFVALAQGEIDLRESLPSRLVVVLRSVQNPQPPNPLGDPPALPGRQPKFDISGDFKAEPPS